MDHQLRKRLLSLMLAVVMVVGMLPVSAFAVETEETIASVQETTEAAAETTEAAQETTEAPVVTEEATEAAEEATEATEEATEATEEATEATEEATEATEEATEATEETTEVTEEATEATEETTEATEATEEIIEPIYDEGVALAVADLPSHMTVTQDKKSTLAPGVTQREIILFDQNGDRVSMFVAVADLDVDTVGVYANYKDNQNVELGMSKTTEQVAAAEAKHEEPYSVVVAINASYYNMITGKPTGTFVMEGNDITTESEGNNYSFFAILKDGTPMIGAKGEYSSYKGQIAEAVGGYIHLVQDGQICAGLNTVQKYPRQTVGVTADNKVIIMSADGNQAPSSIGLTVYEQAEVMLALGCVEAVHLDGGGSMTYCAKPEGSDNIQILNSPSDGSERSVSNSLMFVSTAAPDGAFDHATLSVENEYVTPGSTVTVSSIGVDAAGGAAEIPAEISWQLADSAMGSVENGVFTSNGTAGDAVVQMVFGGKVVGETVIHVVIPESLAFNSAQITIPYGKSVTLEMTALYGANEVAMKDGDVTFTLSNEAAGTISGFDFTACEENAEVTGSTVTASLVHNTELTATAEIVLGKGSEVIYDFEDGTAGGLLFDEPAGTQYNYTFPETRQWIVDAKSGQVHSGEKALAMEVNYGNSLESGYMKTSLVAPSTQTFENATSIGIWLYIPDEADAAWIRWTILGITGFNEDGTPIYTSKTINGQTLDGGEGGTGSVYQFCEPGWHYLSIDTSAYPAAGWKEGQAIMQFYISDRDGDAFGYKYAQNHNLNGKYVFYADDITVDYSSAVDDRNAPVFSSVVYANDTMADAVELNGQTSTSASLSFAANVADVVASNTTGLDETTAKAYIDGNPVGCTFANGKISIDGAYLADGVHSVKFSICDKQGNYASVIRKINVEAGSGKPTVKLVPHDASKNRILLGSLYYIDLVATEIDRVQTVTTTLDLDNMSVWNLAHMEVAEGFSASYSIQTEENIATISVSRTGAVSATGEAVLVSIPVRTWELKMGYIYNTGTKAGQNAFTYAQFKSMKEFWPTFVDVEVDQGLLTLTDESTVKFSGTGVEVATEMWANYANMSATTEGAAYYAAWNGGHIHTEEALEDKAPTCTESGYTGRTFCSVCSSVVTWGTTVRATGHNYGFVNGVLKCTNADCGVLFSGTYTDGKYYVDGVVVVDGWNGDVYYVDGEKLTGIQKIDGFYYDFGEDGVCANQTKYTGLVQGEDGKTYYSKVGALAASWQSVDGEWYYFSHSDYAAVTGEYNYYGIFYTFDESGKLIKGAWVESDEGIRYYYYARNFYHFAWQTIEGVTYFFDENGYRVSGICQFRDSTGGAKRWYEFDENGGFIRILDGLVAVDGVLKYFEDGVLVPAGLLEVDGKLYYINSSGEAVTGKYYVSKYSTEALAETHPEGTYYFGTDGALVDTGFVTIDGVKYYVENGAITAAGFVEVDGAYYYVRSGGLVVTGKYYATNCRTAELKEKFPAGYYYFGEDGKMVDTGFITLDGVKYYVENGAITAAGFVEVDGAYYYTKTGGIVVTGMYYATKCRTEELDAKFPDAVYYFDEDGKLIENGFYEIDGVIYYIENCVITAAGLTEYNGNVYYVKTGGIVVTGNYYVTRYSSDALKQRFPVDSYYFDETGAMILDGFLEQDGVKHYVRNGKITAAGLVEVDGSLYYAKTGGIVVTGKYYVTRYDTTDLATAYPKANYYFDETGAMIVSGFVTENEVKYYVCNGVITAAGLVEVDGDVYYARSGGMIVTGKYYVNKYSTEALARKYYPDYYTFDADGKMI